VVVCCVWQAEKLRSKAQRPEVSRSTQQLCRYLYYLGRIRAIQLEYTEAKDCLQQASRKVLPLEPPPEPRTNPPVQLFICAMQRALHALPCVPWGQDMQHSAVSLIKQSPAAFWQHPFWHHS